MLVRVLIVIVVVAVLGFFGTRGSEKVVAEVTERQELVDEIGKRVALLEEKNRALEAELAQQKAHQAQLSADLTRSTEPLHQRLTDIERREAARESATPSSAAIQVLMARRALIIVDGKKELKDSEGEPDAIHLTVGKHTLELNDGQKRVRYTLVVDKPTQSNKLFIDGTTARAMGDLVLTRAR